MNSRPTTAVESFWRPTTGLATDICRHWTDKLGRVPSASLSPVGQTETAWRKSLRVKTQSLGGFLVSYLPLAGPPERRDDVVGPAAVGMGAVTLKGEVLSQSRTGPRAARLCSSSSPAAASVAPRQLLAPLSGARRLERPRSAPRACAPIRAASISSCARRLQILHVAGERRRTEEGERRGQSLQQCAAWDASTQQCVSAGGKCARASEKRCGDGSSHHLVDRSDCAAATKQLCAS